MALRLLAGQFQKYSHLLLQFLSECHVDVDLGANVHGVLHFVAVAVDSR